MPSSSLRRLMDLPGVDDLEYKAVLKRDFVEPEARAAFPEINNRSIALFGLTPDDAEAVIRPDDWDDIENKSAVVQAAAFEAEGWDVTDNKRRPLRMLAHFSGPMWLAVRGVAGGLPFTAAPDATQVDGWASKLEAEAKRFRKR